MAKLRGGVNQYLQKPKRNKTKKQVVEKPERRSRYEKEAEQVPLPNMKFKDNAPLLVTIVGNNDLINQLTGIPSSNLTCLVKNRSVSLRTVSDFKSYIDLSKISDLVIFSSLEMETFEFLSLMNVHGFTKFCFFSKSDSLAIKRRIWKEVSVRVSVFSKSEQLLTYIARLKVRPLELKSTNPFLFVERVEGESFYGYVRGGPMERKNVHIPGFGDYDVIEIARADNPLDSRSFFEPEILKSASEGNENTDKGGDLAHRSDYKEQIGLKDINPRSDGSSVLGCEKDICSDHSTDNGIEERYKGLTREDLERKYEKRKKSDIGELELQRLRFEKEAENCTSEYIPGNYVRVRMGCNMDELREEFLARKYLLIGTIEKSEKKLVRGRVKTHKWAKGVIKSYDPVIVSMGWYRFQSIPILSIKDSKRNRYLKRNLEDYCDITFFGPARNGRFCLIKEDGFRIQGLGSIEGDGGDRIVKKCKLVGKPFRVFKNSVFIKNMFNTREEVNKFLFGKLKSVSGLRGVIKKPIGQNGNFRGSFEGPLSENDVVFLKCYFPIEVHNMYLEYHKESLKSLMVIKEDECYLGQPSEKGVNRENASKCMFTVGKDDKVKAINTHGSIPGRNTKEEENKKRRNRKFTLPPKIESRLPIDKRRVIETAINIPVAPEEEDFKALEEEIENFRRKKAYIESKAIEDEKLKKEKKIGQKEAGRLQNIIKCVINQKKKHKRKKVIK